MYPESNTYKNWWRSAFSTGLLLLLLSLPALAQDQGKQAKEGVYQEFSGYVGFDYRYFFNDGLYEGQKNSYPSLVIQPEWLYEWNDGNDRLKFIGFGRFDRDSRRTHFDVRELLPKSKRQLGSKPRLEKDLLGCNRIGSPGRYHQPNRLCGKL